MPIVLGYHGCNKEAAQALLGGSVFALSDRSYDWLGSGAYFWEGDLVRAYEWALERRMYSPCVVGAVIELGNCLDLTTQSGIRAVREAYATYIALQERTGQPVPRNEDGKLGKPGDLILRYLDRAVINHLHDGYARASRRTGAQVPEFDTVRALFPEGDRLYANSGFLAKTHIQIAVRKQKQVLGVFRVPAHQLEQSGISPLYDF